MRYFLRYFQGELLWADKHVHKVIEFTLSLLTDDSDKDRSSPAYDKLLSYFSAAGKARIEVSCLIVCTHKTYACTYTYTWTLDVIQVSACAVHTPQLSSHIALPWWVIKVYVAILKLKYRFELFIFWAKSIVYYFGIIKHRSYTYHISRYAYFAYNLWKHLEIKCFCFIFFPTLGCTYLADFIAPIIVFFAISFAGHKFRGCRLYKAMSCDKFNWQVGQIISRYCQSWKSFFLVG